MSESWSQEQIDALLAGGMPQGDDALPELLDMVAPEEDEASVLEEIVGRASENFGAHLNTESPAAYSPELMGFSFESDGAAGTGSIPDALSQEEMDTLGEIGNISMGTAATTMFSLLQRTVNITTPKVTVFSSLTDMLRGYTRPFVAVQVQYVEGLQSNNILLLKEEDALVITSLLMGNQGYVEPGEKLSELHLSAMSELMNQMVGSSATSMANLIDTMVNISPPITNLVQVTDKDHLNGFHDSGEPVIRISFAMEIQDVLKSEIMQVMPLDFGKDIVDRLLNPPVEEAAAGAGMASAPAAAPVASAASAAPVTPAPAASAAPVAPAAPASPPPRSQPMGYGGNPVVSSAAHVASPPPPRSQPERTVDVQPVMYPAFADEEPAQIDYRQDNIGIVIDVPLQVVVELGKTKKSIKEILEFGKGTVVVLDKLAGEPVEVLANGKLIARGEVVVIDDNYGVRITEIIMTAKRMGA